MNMEYLYTFLLCLLGAVDTGYGLQMEATPTTVVSGITTTLEVKCHTLINSSSIMESLMSLIITRSDQDQDKQLASINAFSRDGHVVDTSNETLTGSGKIDNLGESFLRLTWKNPSFNNRGLYVCQAYGVSHTGRPVTLTSAILVNHSYPNTDDLLNEIQNLRVEVEIEKEQCRSNLNTNLYWLKHQMFTTSLPYSYNGHYYLLSIRFSAYQIESNEATCQLLGGYLVEIDSNEEHQFLIDFLTRERNKLPVSHVFLWSMIGLTDELHENVWVNRHSETVANYTNWLSHYPKGGVNNNCVALYYPEWLMIDIPCFMERREYAQTYVCEMYN